jgi:predicted TPR repeat methyltransferase
MLGLTLVTTLVISSENLSPEEVLFRHTQYEWFKSMKQKALINWHIWSEFSRTLVREFQKESEKSASSPSMTQKRHLGIIAAIEEGILAIERFMAHQQQLLQPDHPNEDSQRDAVLAELYVAYGMLLEQLTPIECWKLASDPHTLLIGASERLAEHRSKLQIGPDQDELQLLQLLFLPLCHDNADNAVRNAMSLDATNTQALELLEKLTGKNDPSIVHQRKPKEFVAELFDSFADTFDEKLVGTLQYQVPQLIGEAVRNIVQNEADGASFRAVLDAGCGTGLAGRELRPMIQERDPSGVLVGVDASSKMLNIAVNCTRSYGCGLGRPLLEHETQENNPHEIDNRPLYDRLFQMDLEDMTLSNTLNGLSQEGFDLIVAADVFVYFGSLQRIFHVLASLCVVDLPSWLVFSCERALPEEAPLGFRLMPSGRFAHTKEHVWNMAYEAGFELKDYNEIAPRMERGEPVKGYLFVFEAKRSHIWTNGNEL